MGIAAIWISDLDHLLKHLFPLSIEAPHGILLWFALLWLTKFALVRDRNMFGNNDYIHVLYIDNPLGQNFI